MDIIVSTSPETFSNILKSLGFKIKRKKYFSGILNKRDGRFHALFCKFQNKVYCDLHFDLKIHFMFMGIDYKVLPKIFFNKKIKPILTLLGIKFQTKEVNWFTKRNKSIIKGLRL